MQLLNYVANAMQCAEGFVLERALVDMGMAMANYGMHTLMQVHVTIRIDDAFILDCRQHPPMVPVGCEEQVIDAKYMYTRPFLLL